MGTWGIGILQDDVARDVYDEYMRLFNQRMSHGEILSQLQSENASSLSDEDDGPVIWLAIAKAQWDCGALSPGVLGQVSAIVTQGLGLSRWKEGGPALVRQRKSQLEKFLHGLKSVNPRPKKPRKPIRRKPLYAVGDCLAVQLVDEAGWLLNEWGALIVLGHATEDSDPSRDTYGLLLVGELSYKSATLPTLGDFEARDWLKPNHHSWKGDPNVFNLMPVGYRGVKSRIHLVGGIPIKPDDPKDSRSYCSWRHVGLQVVLQAKWDGGRRW